MAHWGPAVDTYAYGAVIGWAVVAVHHFSWTRPGVRSRCGHVHSAPSLGVHFFILDPLLGLEFGAFADQVDEIAEGFIEVVFGY
jgi:hypothetical protein